MPRSRDSASLSATGRSRSIPDGKSRGSRDLGTSSQPMRSPSDAGSSRRPQSAKQSQRSRRDPQGREGTTPRSARSHHNFTTEEMNRFLLSATRRGRRTAPGEQGVPRGCKRRDYDHAAARSRADLLYMPSQSGMEPVPRKSEREPHRTRGGVTAGVTSERVAQLESKELEHISKPARTVFFPPYNTDPLTHKDFKDVEPSKDPEKVAGMAGVRTDRLTYLNTCQLTTHPVLSKSPLNYQHHNKTDPLRHHGGEHDQQFTHSMFRVSPTRGKSTIPLFHGGGSKRDLTTDEHKFLLKNREVIAGGGQVLYNVAGGEDMLPPATKPYNKAELPPSELYKDQLDKKWLPAMFRYTPNVGGNRALLASEDMYHAMHGPEDGRRLQMIDRANLKQKYVLDDEPNYGPDWPLTEIEKGTWTDRRTATKDLEQPLRWPSNVQPQAGASGSMSARASPFRTPNGLSDWGGLRGLDAWYGGPNTARQTTRSNASESKAGQLTSRRPKSAEALAAGAARTPGEFRLRAASPDAGRGYSGGERRQAALSARGGPQFDATRERGVEFPRSQGSGNAPLGMSVGSRAKGVWSTPNVLSPSAGVESVA